MSVSRVLMWSLAVALVAWAAWLWPDVPARVPVHFGLDGQPARWADRSVWSWFGLPLVGLATAAGLDVVTRWALARPGAPGVNIPNKEAILALPPERRAAVLAHVATMVYWTGVACLAAFALIQADVWATAHGAATAPWTLGGVVVATVGPLAALVVGLARTGAELERQWAAAAGWAGPESVGRRA